MGIYHKNEAGLGEFAPGGEPKDLNTSSTGKPADQVGASSKMGELGAGLKKATKISSLNADGEAIDIPTSGEKSVYNK